MTRGEAPLWAWLVFFAALGLGALLNALKKRGRTGACRRVAAELGLQFSADDPFRLPSGYSHSLFLLGPSVWTGNVMWGEYDGIKVKFFDYTLRQQVGKSTDTFSFVCALVNSPLHAKGLVIRPETLEDKVQDALGQMDIQFESEDFNRQFVVQCLDRQFAFAVLHPRMMELLLAHRGPQVELNGDAILLALPRGNARHVPAEISQMLQLGLGMVPLLPHYLCEQSAVPDTRKRAKNTHRK